MDAQTSMSSNGGVRTVHRAVWQPAVILVHKRPTTNPHSAHRSADVRLPVIWGRTAVASVPIDPFPTITRGITHRGVRKAVGIRRGAISGNMKVSFQAARS